MCSALPFGGCHLAHPGKNLAENLMSAAAKNNVRSAVNTCEYVSVLHKKADSTTQAEHLNLGDRKLVS